MSAVAKLLVVETQIDDELKYKLECYRAHNERESEMGTIIPVLFVLTISLVILAIAIAVLFMFRQRDMTLHLFCASCNQWNYHTFCGPQLDENNNLAFLLYTCSRCHTTRAVK